MLVELILYIRNSIGVRVGLKGIDFSSFIRMGEKTIIVRGEEARKSTVSYSIRLIIV